MQTLPTRSQQWLILLILGLIVLAPILLWLWSLPSYTILNLSGLMRALGQLSGLLGATLFSVNFVLAARLGWLEEVLHGLPRVYNLHHLFGGLALILLSVHPTFLGLQYLPTSVSAAASFFEPNLNDVPKMLGVAAFSVISLLIIITFFIRIAYHHWKSTHQWLGLALVLASLHVYLMPGHLDTMPVLRWYMLGLMTLGLLAFSYRVILGKWLIKRYKYKVVDVKHFPGLATSISLRPLNNRISYRAGQFFFMRVHSEKGVTRESHPFSFVSSPKQNEVQLVAKEAGDYTKTLYSLEKGAEVDLEGPYGRFIFDLNDETDQIWIAGGVGITPFMSRARELSSKQVYKIHLYYVVKNKEQALFLNELKKNTTEFENFNLTIWESDIKGRFAVDCMKKTLCSNTNYFICGPKGLMQDVAVGLKKNSVSSHRIRLEEFTLY